MAQTVSSAQCCVQKVLLDVTLSLHLISTASFQKLLPFAFQQALWDPFFRQEFSVATALKVNIVQ
jgi:hypothetical protein